jgi:outer membrane protein TolC
MDNAFMEGDGMKRHLMSCLVSFFLMTFLSIAIGPANGYGGESKESQGMLELPGLIREALERNPDIIAARDRWKSAQAIIEARRAFPDPHFSYGYFIESVETRVGPQEHILSAKQTFPFYGKRNLRADIAAKEAENLKQVYEATKREVIRQVRTTFYDLFHVVILIDITHREKTLLERFERIARTKYETGRGLQQNILKVHVEISKLNEKLLNLEKHKQTAEAMLNTLLNRPPTEPLAKPRQPDLMKITLGLEDLLELAKENCPELKAAQALIEKGHGAYKLAKKDYYPNLTVGVNYIAVGDRPGDVEDEGKDAFNVMLSINLPIWRKKLSSQAQSALDTIAAHRSHYRNMLNQTLFEVKDNFFKIQTARDTIELYENALIPQAEQSMESAEAGYITGIVSFLDLLDAERVLLNVQFGYWQAYTQYLKHVNDLERAVGTRLTEYGPG